MKLLASILAAAVLAGSALPARAADNTKVRAATQQVETGAKKIGDGQIGPGVEETAKGIGNTIVEGAKYSGHTIKDFFSRLFGS
jgi:predicted Zn-dependent protease